MKAITLMPKLLTHPDSQIHTAFSRLKDALVSFSRATNRNSTLIFRDNAADGGTIADSLVQIRLQDGIPVDPECSDMTDDMFLRKFADSMPGFTYVDYCDAERLMRDVLNACNDQNDQANLPPELLRQVSDFRDICTSAMRRGET